MNGNILQMSLLRDVAEGIQVKHLILVCVNPYTIARYTKLLGECNVELACFRITIGVVYDHTLVLRNGDSTLFDAVVACVQRVLIDNYEL